MTYKLLIVEDESFEKEALKKIIKKEYQQITIVGTATSGIEAVSLAKKLKPDIILMDIKMPRIDGLKASKIIGKQLDIPIVIITAYSQKEFIEKAQQDNIVGYIIKPISKENLIPAIEIALHQAKKTNKLRTVIQDAKEEVRHRIIIEKAKGIIMDKQSLTEEEAFKYLRNTSMSNRLLMYELAEQIVSNK